MQASPAPSKLQNCTTSTQSPLFRPPGGTRVATGCLHASRPTAMQICWVSATRDPARQLSHKFRSANRYEILALSLLLRLTTTLRAAQTGKVILGQGADTAYPPLLRNAAMPLRCRGTLLLCRPLQRRSTSSTPSSGDQIDCTFAELGVALHQGALRSPSRSPQATPCGLTVRCDDEGGLQLKQSW
jgi:hypothetical protein